MYLKFLFVLANLETTWVYKGYYLSAYFIDELFGVDGVISLGSDDLTHDFVSLFVDKFLEIVKDGLVDFAHFDCVFERIKMLKVYNFMNVA